MNRIMTEYYPTFRMYQGMRDQLIDLLADEDLGYSPGGSNPPLGQLCREIGEVEHAYIQSFRTFKQDFSYRDTTPGMEGSVAQLKGWFAALDGQLQAAVESLSDEDISSKVIDRGSFELPPQINLDVYKEALLIFYGKATVYARAMGKELPEQWREWIG
jgi:hypothetical protein